MPTPSANWYPDPQRPGWLRYWDGMQWTQHSAPAPLTAMPTQTTPLPYAAAPAANGRRPKRALKKVAIASVTGVVALAIIGSVVGGDDTDTSTTPSASATRPSAMSTSELPAGLAGPTDDPAAAGGASGSSTKPARLTLYPVTSVLDGDTIKVRIKGSTYRVRVLGIDTPELATQECYAQKAASRMQSLVQSKSVALTRDSRQPDRDRYGRLVRHVILADGSYAGYSLLKGGFAKEYVPRGDYAGRATFLKAQAYAKAKKLGVWSAACAVPKPTAPVPFVGPSKQPTTPPTSDTCTIKGNISSSGEKIYHVPGQRFYNATVITPSKGERWFCSESDAVAAGWRKAKV